MTKHFTLRELTASADAKRLGIDNTPSEVDLVYAQRLANALEIIREAYGKPIIVSSGFRCDKLNKAVKGAKNSDHKYFCAADIRSVSDSIEDNKELFDLIVELSKNGLELRQIIDEYNYDWVHISINNEYNKYKHNEILHLK